MATQSSDRYIQFLPGIYREDSSVAQFLEPFAEVLAGFEGLLDVIDRFFAPAFTDPDFLPWLSQWVALLLDEEWDESKRRRLISEAVELYRWRGTVSGLKRYLEIYTGLAPDIREWRWPEGMQIGVASQIGGTTPTDASLADVQSSTQRQPVAYYSYYVVDTVAPAGHPVVPEGQPLQRIYRTNTVERVDIGANYVDIWLLSTGGSPATIVHHEPASVSRRDHLIDDQYTIQTPSDPSVVYHGDTLLVDEVELPYRFVVDVQVPREDMANVKLDKVRAILGLEKPAHTMYYLKLTPVAARSVLQPMQIEVRSTVGQDTIVG